MPTLNNLYPIFGCGQNVLGGGNRENYGILFDMLHHVLGIQQIFYDIEENLYLTIVYGSTGGAFISPQRISFLKHTSGNIPLTFNINSLQSGWGVMTPGFYTEFKTSNPHYFIKSSFGSNSFYIWDKFPFGKNIGSNSLYNLTPFTGSISYKIGSVTYTISYPSKTECFGSDYWELEVSGLPINSSHDKFFRTAIFTNKRIYAHGIYMPRGGATGIYWIGCPTLECVVDGVSIISNYQNIFFYVSNRTDSYNDYPVYSISGGTSDVAKVIWRGVDGYWYASPEVGVADSAFGYFKSQVSTLEHLNQSSYVQLDKVYTGEEPRTPPISDYIRVKNYESWFSPSPRKCLYITRGEVI